MYYDTSLQEAFARSLRTHSKDLPDTCKTTFLLGRYLQTDYNGIFYSKAQNLRRTLSKAYDEALEDCDVLLMPTIPKKAPTFPSPNASLEGRVIKHNSFNIFNRFNCSASFDFYLFFPLPLRYPK